MTSLASKAYLPISCGGIRSVFAFKGLIQPVFHRNLENGHSRLAALGLGSDRLPRNAAICYVKPAILDHPGICKNKTAGRKLADFRKSRLWLTSVTKT